jgi:hypothetical protein
MLRGTALFFEDESGNGLGERLEKKALAYVYYTSVLYRTVTRPVTELCNAPITASWRHIAEDFEQET